MSNITKEFIENKEAYKNGWRGTYLIIPIKIVQGKKFCESSWCRENFFDYELLDKSDLLKRRCETGYIKKYILRIKR